MNEQDKNSPSTSASQEQPAMKTWQCVLCGFVYSEMEGMPQDGVPAGTRWEDVPDSWICPDCSASKVDFEMVEV